VNPPQVGWFHSVLFFAAPVILSEAQAKSKDLPIFDAAQHIFSVKILRLPSVAQDDKPATALSNKTGGAMPLPYYIL